VRRFHSVPHPLPAWLVGGRPRRSKSFTGLFSVLATVSNPIPLQSLGEWGFTPRDQTLPVQLTARRRRLVGLLNLFPLFTCRNEVLSLSVIKNKLCAHPTRHLPYRGCKLLNFSGSLRSIGI
jgi:hypothetical protein